MADTKISALTGATTPLAGTEVVPVVQGGQTRKVSVADLTAGRAISATQLTLTTENLVIATSGKGIDFSATSGTGTSELLDDYEEGIWTPIIEGTTTAGTGTYTDQNGHYTKIGDVVYFSVEIGWSAHTGTGNMNVTGLPFTSSSAGSVGFYSFPIATRFMAFTNQLSTIMLSGGTVINIISIANGVANAGVPMDTSVTWVTITGCYKAA